MEEKRQPPAEEPRIKLASAEELRGKKSGTNPKQPGGKHRVWIVLLILVAAAGIAFGVIALTRKQPSAPVEEPTAAPLPQEEQSAVLVEGSRSDVESVTIEPADGIPCTIVQHYTYDADGKRIDPEQGPGYTLAEPADFGLDQSRADAIIGYAANLTALSRVTDAAENLADFGLETPKSTVTMRYRDGHSDVWLIGSQAPTSTGSYVARKDSREVFLLYASAAENLSADRNSLHTVEMPWALEDASPITDILIENEGQEPIEIAYVEETGSTDLGFSVLELRQPIHYAANLDRCYEIFTGTAELTIQSYAGELSELEDTGLEDGGAVTRVTFKALEGSGEAAHVYRLGRFADADHRYVMVDDTNAVYLTDAASLAFLNSANKDYLVDLFANLINIKLVNEVDVATVDDSWSLRIERVPAEDQSKTEDVFYFDGEEADSALARRLYTEVIGVMNSHLSGDEHLDGDVYCRVTYTLNVDPGTVTVEYLAYDDEYLAVRRDGSTMFLTKRASVDQMIRAFTQFREGTWEPGN